LSEKKAVIRGRKKNDPAEKKIENGLVVTKLAKKTPWEIPETRQRRSVQVCWISKTPYLRRRKRDGIFRCSDCLHLSISIHKYIHM